MQQRCCLAVFTLAQLEQAIREAWSLDTAEEDDATTSAAR
jgi:hypothetical protein